MTEPDERAPVAEMIDNTQNLDALAAFAAAFIRAGCEVSTEAVRADGRIIAFRGMAFD